MPGYDLSLWDFLKYASTQKPGKLKEDVFPLNERIEMTKRICDGLLYMNKMGTPHRDIKPRSVHKILYDVQIVLRKNVVVLD